MNPERVPTLVGAGLVVLIWVLASAFAWEGAEWAVAAALGVLGFGQVAAVVKARRDGDA